MRKYTKKEVLEQRISFKPMTEEQFKKLKKHFGVNITYYKTHYYRFYFVGTTNYGSRSKSYLNSAKSIKSTLEISFEEFDFEEEFVLPKKWYIENEYQDVRDYLSKTYNSDDIKRWFYDYIGWVGSLYYNGCFSDWNENEFIKREATKISYDQFKKYILKENNMEKKIIGYNLIKPEYKKAALNIATVYNFGTLDKKFDFCNNSIVYDKLKKAGVLDLWFEPVYEESEKIVEIGNPKFTLKIKDKKVYHNNEDITKFVLEIHEYFKNLYSVKPNVISYPLEVNFDALRFTKTGCQNSESTLKEWLNIYDMIK